MADIDDLRKMILENVNVQNLPGLSHAGFFMTCELIKGVESWTVVLGTHQTVSKTRGQVLAKGIGDTPFLAFRDLLRESAFDLRKYVR